jgi:flagellar hook-length control protein FliK
MNRHNIPVTEGNVSQFQAYREGENPILTKVLDLSQEIPKLLSELTSENSGEALKVFGKELLSILPQQSAPELFKAPTLSLLSEEERLEVMELLPEEVLSEEVKGAIEDGSASAKAVLSLLPEETLEHPLVSVLEESVLEYQTETGQLSALLTKEELSDFSALLSDFPISEDLKEQIASGEANTGEVMRSLQNALAGATQTQVFELFRSPVFQSILQENIISGWTLNTKELTKEKAVERLYESMQKEMASLERLLKGALPDSEAAASLSEKAQHVQQNMDFMNVLNQFYPYVQLPLQLREQMTHGDLYVFTKKKELAKNKDQISVLLHLDMEQLGPLDIHLSLNKNQVSSAFYVEDRSVQRLLQSNIEELSVALSEKGYQFSSTFSVRERSIDIVKDFIEKDAPVAGVKRYSFDIRA